MRLHQFGHAHVPADRDVIEPRVAVRSSGADHCGARRNQGRDHLPFPEHGPREKLLMRAPFSKEDSRHIAAAGVRRSSSAVSQSLPPHSQDAATSFGSFASISLTTSMFLLLCPAPTMALIRSRSWRAPRLGSGRVAFGRAAGAAS